MMTIFPRKSGMAETLRTLLDRALVTRVGLVMQSLAVGLLAGLAVSLFRSLLNLFEGYRISWYATVRSLNAASGHAALLVGTVAIVILLLALFLGWMSARFPMIRGSGIPQIKGVFMGKMRLRWIPELLFKILGGSLGIGAGLSLGREGPSVQIGAYVGQSLEALAPRTELERRYLITSGAAAGLAAAFNAPLAGVLFALEELNKHVSPLLLACCMAASVAGDFVASHFFGLGPVFKFPSITLLPLLSFPWVVTLGAVCAIVGDLYKRSLYWSQDLYAVLRIPMRLRVLLPLLLSVPVCLFLSDVAGGGHALIERLAHNGAPFGLLAVWLGAKIAYTALCYGSGAPGGIFLPLLCCGALCGTMLASILAGLGWLDPLFMPNFLILGMAGFFSAVARAPVTGAVLILEMSGNLSHLGSLVLVCLAASIVADLIRSRPVYDVLLWRQLTIHAA